MNQRECIEIGGVKLSLVQAGSETDCLWDVCVTTNESEEREHFPSKESALERIETLVRLYMTMDFAERLFLDESGVLQLEGGQSREQQ